MNRRCKAPHDGGSGRYPAGLTLQDLHEPLLPPGCINLSCGNPTRWGLAPDAQQLGLRPWDPSAPYAPDPLGQPDARAALARALQAMGQTCAADALVLCASTSEAFGHLFKLMGRPGDGVAVARPGYPLVAHLAEAEGLVPRPFGAHLRGGRWRIDLPALQAALAAGARVVVLISPNNPTGARVDAEDWPVIVAACNAHDALLVVDEVFAPYGWRAPHAQFAPLQGAQRAASLGGLSKALCLPQAKLSWIVLGGDPAFVAWAKAQLTWLADLHLSVGGYVQAELPQMLAAMPAVQARVRARVAANFAALRQSLAGAPGGAAAGEAHAAEAGWYALVTLPARALGADGTGLARLERGANVRLQPAALFDLAAPRQVVASLLLTPEAFAQGWGRVAAIARP